MSFLSNLVTRGAGFVAGKVEDPEMTRERFIVGVASLAGRVGSAIGVVFAALGCVFALTSGNPAIVAGGIIKTVIFHDLYQTSTNSQNLTEDKTNYWTLRVRLVKHEDDLLNTYKACRDLFNKTLIIQPICDTLVPFIQNLLPNRQI